MPLIPWSIRKSRGDSRGLALKLALAGKPEGTVVVQNGRSNNVEFSAILRPKPNSPVQLLRLVSTFCTSEGIRKDTGIISWIKWPNFILANEAVVATTETTLGPGNAPEWVVISTRVNNSAVREAGATSLYDLLGTEVDEKLLIEKILESLDWMYYGYSREMYSHIIQRARSMMETMGRRVEVTRSGKIMAGVVKDLDDEGRLVVDLGTARKSLRVEFSESLREL